MSIFVSPPHNILPYASRLWWNFPGILYSAHICDLVWSVYIPRFQKTSVWVWTEMHVVCILSKISNCNTHHWYSGNMCAIFFILKGSALILRFIDMGVGLLISTSMNICSSPPGSSPQKSVFSTILNKPWTRYHLHKNSLFPYHFCICYWFCLECPFEFNSHIPSRSLPLWHLSPLNVIVYKYTSLYGFSF